MLLYWSSRSPCVRKVAITIDELAVRDRIEYRPTFASFEQPTPAELGARNPLGQIPTLVLDDGTAIYDSRVICAWLNLNLGGNRLMPASPADRLQADLRESLGDGLIAKAVRRLVESSRLPDARSQAMVTALQSSITRVLDALEQAAPGWSDPLDIGLIAIGTALSYLDFRGADLHWRDGRPQLAGWYAQFAARPASRANPFGVDLPTPLSAREP
jgi:glutathione S-transferase